MYQAGTLSGNPLATAAGLAVLRHGRRRRTTTRSSARVACFAEDLESALSGGGLAACVPSLGPLVGLFVAPAGEPPLAPPADYLSARALARNGVYAALLPRHVAPGVALAPGPYEVLFPGLAHDDGVLAQVVEAAGEAAAEVEGRSRADAWHRNRRGLRENHWRRGVRCIAAWRGMSHVSAERGRDRPTASASSPGVGRTAISVGSPSVRATRT